MANNSKGSQVAGGDLEQYLFLDAAFACGSGGDV
jgi:hypothetical protein